MLCPVLCTCGKSLAIYYAAFKAIRAEETKKALESYPGEIHPDMINAIDGVYPELGKHLDNMSITRECCRQLILTNIEFREVY